MIEKFPDEILLLLLEEHGYETTKGLIMSSPLALRMFRAHRQSIMKNQLEIMFAPYDLPRPVIDAIQYIFVLVRKTQTPSLDERQIMRRKFDEAVRWCWEGPEPVDSSSDEDSSSEEDSSDDDDEPMAETVCFYDLPLTLSTKLT